MSLPWVFSDGPVIGPCSYRMAGTVLLTRRERNSNSLHNELGEWMPILRVCDSYANWLGRLTDYPAQSISCPVHWKLPLLSCLYLTAIRYCQTGSYMNSQHPSQSMRVHMKMTILSSFTHSYVFSKPVWLTFSHREECIGLSFLFFLFFYRDWSFINWYKSVIKVVHTICVQILQSLEVIWKLRPKFHSKLVELVKWTWELKQSDLWMNHLKCFCELDH